MFDITIDFFKHAGEWGVNLFGIVFICLSVTFITFTGLMVLFLIYRQAFAPKHAKSDSIHYTLIKSIAIPFILSMLKDLSKAANDKVNEKQNTSKKQKSNINKQMEI